MTGGRRSVLLTDRRKARRRFAVIIFRTRKNMNAFRNRILKSCLLIIFTAFGGNVLYAQTNDSAIDKQIDNLFSGYNLSTPGIALAVVKDGKIIFKKGYGAANLEYETPITPKTVFQIASVSKQFTAFSIYLLEKQGKISLEDDIRKYLREVPDFGKPVKIKHLLAHTSGIRDQWSLLTLAGWRMDDIITTEQILKIISRQKELNFEPGSRFLYSNSGYTLLAEIAARVSGKTFAEFTKENIFTPLAMNDTQFYDDANKIVKNRAGSYEKVGGAYRKKNLNHSAVGATGLLTTVEDLSKWALNFENPTVGDAELFRRFNAPSLLDNGQPVLFAVINGENSYHAKGQFTRNYRGIDLLNHSGHDAGFRTFLLRFPAKKLSIIALSNDEHINIFQTAFTIADLYLKNDLKETPRTSAANNASEIVAPVQESNNNLRDFEGKFYSAELGTDYTARTQNGKLVLAHTRLSDVILTETGKDKFAGNIEFAVEIEFLRDKANAVTGFKISNFGAKNVRFEKVK
jgi:CubicO group peptidase (beta-lactamase class C family)